MSKDTSAARGAPSATAGASFFAAFAAVAAFGAAFVGAGAAAGASRTIGFAAAGFVSRSAASWRWNSVRPAAGTRGFCSRGGRLGDGVLGEDIDGRRGGDAGERDAGRERAELLAEGLCVCCVYGVQAHASEQMR